jgi:hypothetical protein
MSTVAEVTLIERGRPGLAQLLGWMLTDRERFREALAEEGIEQELLPRLLAIVLTAFALYGLVMEGVLIVTGARLDALVPPGATGRPIGVIPLAYALGLVGAIGICLPSFYFYALQCGFRPSLRRIVIATLAGQALTGMLLIGIIPVYAAGILAAERLDGGAAIMWSWSWVGLLLPLPAGLIGVADLRSWFARLAETLPAGIRAQRRGMVGFLALWSAGLYAVVAPTVVWKLIDLFGKIL